jgi:hypothetical protein
VLRHGGAVSGFTAYNAIVPSTKSALVVLCNKDGGLGSLPDTLLNLLVKDESHIPKVAGLPVGDEVRKIFAQFQTGKVERARLGKEFNIYLSDEKIAGASRRLKSLGTPKEVQVTQKYERGGLEVSRTRLTFGRQTIQVLMYRAPEGTIEQFFVEEP